MWVGGKRPYHIKLFFAIVLERERQAAMVAAIADCLFFNFFIRGNIII